MSEADREFREMIIQTSLVAHQGYRDEGRSLAEGMISLGASSIQAVLAINGGASVAVLALIGSLASRQSLPPVGFDGVVPALACFGVGTLLSGLAAAFAFLAQGAFAAAHADHALTFSQTPIMPNPSAVTKQCRGGHLRIAAILLVAGGYSLFGAGSISLGLSAAEILGYLQATAPAPSVATKGNSATALATPALPPHENPVR